MIGAVEKAKLVYILNRDAAANLTISSPLEAHKQQAIILSIVGVDVGFDNPMFAALEVDYGDSDADPTGEAFNNAEKVSLGPNPFIDRPDTSPLQADLVAPPLLRCSRSTSSTSDSTTSSGSGQSLPTPARTSSYKVRLRRSLLDSASLAYRADRDCLCLFQYPEASLRRRIDSRDRLECSSAARTTSSTATWTRPNTVCPSRSDGTRSPTTRGESSSSQRSCTR